MQKTLNSSGSSGVESSRPWREFPLQNLSAGVFLNESGTAVGLMAFRLLIEAEGFFANKQSQMHMCIAVMLA